MPRALARRLMVALLLCAGLLPAMAMEGDTLEDMLWQPPVVTNPPSPPALWFPIGERLVYGVHWGPFTVAEAVMTTEWVRWRDGRLLVRLRYRTVSNRYIERIYPVDDQIDSFVDPATFLPVRFVKNMSEGSRRELAVLDFNHPEGIVRWRKIVRKYEDIIIPIPPGVRDIPSLSYWIRKEGFADGAATNSYRVMADDKLYDLALRVKDARERVTVPGYGSVPALQLAPSEEFEGLFASKGKVTMTVSRGVPCLMLSMDAEVPVARIKIRLSEIGGPGSEAWRDIWKSSKR